MIKGILFFLALLLLLPSIVSAATINADSCSQADVQAAINSAQDGDSVNVPPGECTWTSHITINKEIAVIGAGLTINGETSDKTKVP